MDDDMPDEYKYPRHDLRSVRTELYTLMSKLSPDLQISKRQIEGASATITCCLIASGNLMIHTKHLTRTHYQV